MRRLLLCFGAWVGMGLHGCDGLVGIEVEVLVSGIIGRVCVMRTGAVLVCAIVHGDFKNSCYDTQKV